MYIYVIGCQCIFCWQVLLELTESDVTISVNMTAALRAGNF